MARYNTERLSNRMDRVKPFATLRETISEAYYPKMSSQITSRAWPARPQNVQLSDLNRGLDDIKLTISDMETFIDRFKLACDEGTARDVGSWIFHSTFSVVFTKFIRIPFISFAAKW